VTAALCALFFVSGAAALLFETLWFRQTGLLLGNSVWTSALVTAGFMGGLALGNLVVARRAWRWRRPLRVYAGLELAVAASGTALVLGLPVLIPVLAPVLARLGEAALLDAARLVGGFLLLVVPSSAMGATLPVLARSLGAHDANFGRVLGRLYGWNTLGAVTGALLGEAWLIGALGVRGTACAAAALDVIAAAGGLFLDSRLPDLQSAPAPTTAGPLDRRASRIVASTLLAGGLLLALEVVWFRFLLLFVVATSAMFAAMLAAVLLGIGLGGLAASAWLARGREEERHAPVVALAAGVAVVATYAGLDAVMRARDGLVSSWEGALALSLWLMLPACLASGTLFTLLGRALHGVVGEESRAAGLLTLGNTVGAMLGALFGGFVLLPIVGIERSLLLLAGGYALVALLAPLPSRPGRERWARRAAWALFAATLALFPSGFMRARYAQRVVDHWAKAGARLAAMKEGLTETVFLFVHETLGRPHAWRLVTNGMGMSATDYIAGRYMGLFVWLPVALHPQPRTALVISYGLGTTARALVDTRELTAIDVVDVSADVLKMSGLRWPVPSANPLRDPRVSIHVEDGRFFLLETARRYDVITGEPPPPKSAGIVNLYSREYFGLVRDRLAEGGIASYWLPVLHFAGPEALSVIKGFCDVFADCSLWTGYGHEWLLVGSRGASGPGSADRFARQWSDPTVAARLRAAGFESPADLGATFLADASTLRELTASALPLVDDHPYRLDPTILRPPPSPVYKRLMEMEPARDRFRASALVRRLWPSDWIEPTLAAFPARALVDRLAWTVEEVAPAITLPELEAAVRPGGGEALALWYLGSSAEEQALAANEAARGSHAPELIELEGLAAFARRDYRAADTLLGQAEPFAQHAPRLRRWRILALGLAGEKERAVRLMADAGALMARPGERREDWIWLSTRFGLDSPP
jgi:predicted membrane-bound spermidine synthase